MKKNKTKLINNLKPYIINILITIGIFLICFIINKMSPFGPFSYATIDAYYQYQPMLYNFLTSLKEGLLQNYTLTTSLGGSFIFNYVYYLSSPLNLLALPFKNPNTMFLVITSIKLIITSITTTFYVHKKTKNSIISTIVSISYTFSSWFLAYGKNIMWLDAFMIFPLFQYGLEQLLKENKKYLYIFTLSYIMISNFYIAFMICIYTLIYFIINILTHKEEIAKKLKKFNTITLATGITLLLSFWYIYMTYDSFTSVGLYLNEIINDTTSITILDFIKSFFYGNINTQLLQTGKVFPNIALSTIFTINLLYFFINPKVNIKEKIKYLIISILIIITIYSKPINYLINCFHVPSGYAFRYSFIISFLLIILFLRNYQTFENKIYKRIYIINAILIILLIIELLFKNIETKLFIFNITSILIFTILFLFYRNNNIYKIIFTSAVIVEVGISCIFNINSEMKFNPKEFTYQKEITTYREIINYASQEHLPYNLNLYDNKSIISYYSSMYYNNVHNDLEILGCKIGKAMINNCQYTPIFKTLFSIKTDNDYYLEKIFAVNKDIMVYSLNSPSILENQNLLLEGLTNINNTFEKNLKTDKNQENTFIIEKEGIYYTIINNNFALIIDNEAYTLNKDLIKDKNIKVNILETNSLLKLSFNKKDKIKIIYHESFLIPEHPFIYYFNQKNFEKAYNQLKNNEIKYSVYEQNKIEGTINVEKDQIIFTTIPYDKNWKVKIDEKEVETTYVLNSLLAIEVPPGKHKITLEYKTNYTIPVLISTTTFIVLITSIIINKRKQKKNEN